MEELNALPVYARFTIEESVTGGVSRQLQFQQFINVWTRVTSFSEIMARRLDETNYLEEEKGKWQLILETFFSHEEAQLLMAHFPKQFNVLAQA